MIPIPMMTPTPTSTQQPPTPTPTPMPGGLPSAPTNLTAVSRNRSVYLSWDVPTGQAGTNQNYIIQQKLNGQPDSSFTLVVEGFSPLRYATLLGLNNGTSYVFRVAAENSSGIGPYSSNSVPVTPSHIPFRPLPPTCIPGNGQVTLNWIAPKTRGTPITNYIVQRKIKGQPDNTYRNVEKEVSTNTTTVATGLTNGRRYVFRVAAVSIKGRSLFSLASAGVIPLLPTPTKTPTPTPTPTKTPTPTPTPTPTKTPTPTPTLSAPTPTPVPGCFVNYNRSTFISSSHVNWGILRSAISNNINNWGSN